MHESRGVYKIYSPKRLQLNPQRIPKRDQSCLTCIIRRPKRNRRNARLTPNEYDTRVVGCAQEGKKFLNHCELGEEVDVEDVLDVGEGAVGYGIGMGYYSLHE